MTRLLLAELSRLKSRRLSLIAVIAVLLALGGLQFAVYYSVKPLSTTELAQNKAYYEQAKQDYESNKADYQAGEKECVAQGGTEQQCSQEPKPEDYAQRTPTPFGQITDIIVSVSVFLTGLAILFVGASFIGAEYSSGALANWLSFIPERGKVFASKLLALVLASAVVSALASALTIGLAVVMTKAAGAVVSGVHNVVELAGRGVLVAIICAVLGFGLAMVTRHTIAAAGTVLGYLFVSFVLSAVAGAVPALQALKSWLPEYNILAFLRHGYTYYSYVNVVTAQGSDYNEVAHKITFAHSAGYWSVIVVVVVAVAFAVFRRRDVN
jgi:ABC-2 type transport system permease protein